MIMRMGVLVCTRGMGAKGDPYTLTISYLFIYLHIHFIDPTFVHRQVNMKHVRKCRLHNATWSKNILTKNIYSIHVAETIK
jgi:hypothetical protein